MGTLKNEIVIVIVKIVPYLKWSIALPVTGKLSSPVNPGGLSTPTLPSPGPSCGARLPSRTPPAPQIVGNVYQGLLWAARAAHFSLVGEQILDHLADVLAGNLLLIWFNKQRYFTYIHIQCGFQEFGDQRRVSDDLQRGSGAHDGHQQEVRGMGGRFSLRASDAER